MIKLLKWWSAGLMIRWRAKIKLTSVTHHLFLNVFEAQPSVSFHSSSSHRSTISILKITFFRNEIDWIGLFILFPLKTEHVKVTRSNKKFQWPQRFCGIFENFLTIFKAKLSGSLVVYYCRSVLQMAEYKRENIIWPYNEKFNL